MQNGRTIYYNGNTISRSISIPSIKKRIDQQEEISVQRVIMPIIDKVFATNQCIWCNRLLADYQIYCNFCHNCQYCGMVMFSNIACQNCGNHPDDDLRTGEVKRETVIY